MAMQISHWLAQKLLDLAFRGVAWTPPSAVYVALYTSDPTAADTGTEVSGGGYARVSILFAAAALDSGQMTIKSSALTEFADATANWGLVTHVGLRDAATGGHLLCSRPLMDVNGDPAPRSILTGDKPKFPLGSALVRFIQ